MKWLDVLHKANNYEKQKTADTLESHMDAKVELEQAMEAAQKQAQDIEAAAAKVIADQKVNQMRLNRAQDALAQAENSAKFAAQQAQANGETAENPGKFLAQARMLAMDVASKREQVDTAQKLVDASNQAAEQARLRAQEAQEALREAMSRRDALEGKIDQAKMEAAMATSMKSLENAVNTTMPTLDQVEAKVEQQYAEATSTTELAATTNAAVGQMDLHHAQLQSNADSILNELMGKSAETPTSVGSGS